MKSVNWERPATVGDQDIKRLEPGGYVVRVISAIDHEDKEYFELVFDIAEGPHVGFYSDAWGVEHPYAHRIIMSYKSQALNMLEGRLNAIDKSNPGFDSRAVLDANRFDMLVGRLVGVVMREIEYEKKDGSIGVRVDVDKVITADDVRSGNFKVLDKKTLKPSAAQTQAAPTSSTTDDVVVPF